jgi:hypothetical protein
LAEAEAQLRRLAEQLDITSDGEICPGTERGPIHLCNRRERALHKALDGPANELYHALNCLWSGGVTIVSFDHRIDIATGREGRPRALDDHTPGIARLHIAEGVDQPTRYCL